MSGHWARGYLGLAGADQNGGSGGGAGIFTVAARYDPEADKIILDHTAREILTVAENGTPIYIVSLDRGEGYISHAFGFLVAVNGDNDGTGFLFSMGNTQVSSLEHENPANVADLWIFEVQSLDDYPSLAN